MQPYESDTPLVLRPSPVKRLLVFAGCLMFVLVGCALSNRDAAVSGMCVLFFGAGGVVALLQLIPCAAYLLLDRKGFTMRTLFRDHVVAWDEVDRFFVLRVRSGPWS